MSTSPAAVPKAPPLPIYRLSVAQYHAMAEHGILTSNDKVELIEGLLVAKVPGNAPHRVLSIPPFPNGPAFPMPLYQLTVPQYHAMAEHGILTSNDRVELIHGWLVQKMTLNPPHAVSMDLVRDALTGLVPTGWHVRSQAPVSLAQSEPEPDGCVARGHRRDYAQRHPTPAEIGLLVEVSDSSLAHDRDVKGPLYASAGIPVYWIVNLVDNALEVYTDPSGPTAQPGYATRRVLGPNDDVEVVLAGQVVGRVAVRDLLP